MTNPRRVAFDVLRRVHDDDAYSHIALDTALTRSDLAANDRGLTATIVYGVLTWRRALDRLIDRALRKKLDSLDAKTLDVLRIGAYQIRFLRVPDHAALNETVELAKSVGVQPKFVNALLRQIAQNDEDWWGANPERKAARYLGERWSLPNWLGNRLVQQFGFERAESLAEAFNMPPPIWLREVGGGPQRVERLDADVRTRLEAGEVVVEDLGAQRVVELCAAAKTDHVLDACAGLGGKTLHLAEHAASVHAVDPIGSKVDMLNEAAARVGVQDRVTTHLGELASLGEATYDGVLVDAPCTGLGVLRRHPETRWRRSEPDIGRLAKVQADLLDQAVKHVKPGGWLVYSVCTWTREESSKQVEQFLERHNDFELDGEYLQTMPDTEDADGFFAARMVRG